MNYNRNLLIYFRYLFEPDHSKFFPTICLENGPIDLGIMWPEAAMGVPKFDEVAFNKLLIGLLFIYSY